MTVTLHYFPLRGRGEVIRLALELRGVQYAEQAPDYAAMKQDQDAFPFGQCPRLVDGDINCVQSNAILRCAPAIGGDRRAIADYAEFCSPSSSPR
jgi:glutathione S-transferase